MADFDRMNEILKKVGSNPVVLDQKVLPDPKAVDINKAFNDKHLDAYELEAQKYREELGINKLKNGESGEKVIEVSSKLPEITPFKPLTKEQRHENSVNGLRDSLIAKINEDSNLTKEQKIEFIKQIDEQLKINEKNKQ